ncbi:MAG: DUF1566 domain-containing protein [Patescibacteria group bacterium]
MKYKINTMFPYFIIFLFIFTLTIPIQNASAGSLTPSSAPAANGYTLSGIYNRLITNTSAVSGSHSFAPTTTPQSTFPTLIDIYNAIPTIYPTDFLASSTYLGITGSITVKTGDTVVASSSAQGTSLVLTVPQGYYSGGSSVTVSTSSASFVAGSIKSGVTIFGIIGTLIESLGNAVVADVFSGKTFSNTTDSNITGTLNLACNTATFNGTANLVATAYDGAGDGSNRWCVTDTGDAVAGDLLSGKKSWVDGVEITGSVSAGSNVTGSNGTLAMTIPDGLYSGSKTATANDTNLVTGNIKSGITLFGVAGNSNVVDTTSGTAVAGDLANNKIAFSAGSQITGTMFTNMKNQTKDDYVNGAGTTGEYTSEESTWSAVSGSPFSGYDAINYLGATDLYSGAVKQDGRTGLWWSDVMAVGATASTTTNVFTLSADGSRPTGGLAIGFCDALNSASFAGYTDWYLPTQKQLMQAYIDGASNNLLNAGSNSYWTSTEDYSTTNNAWRSGFKFSGTIISNTKVTTTGTVHCVRP